MAKPVMRVVIIYILFFHYTSLLAQVQVSKEPMHHNVFENDAVRILDVHIPAGDTSLFHKHSTPSVFLVLSNTKTGSEVITEPKSIRLNDGNIWFEGFYEQPRIHRVWNSDTAEFHVIDMEILNRNPVVIDPEMQINSLEKLFDEKPVRGYRLTVAPQSKLELPARKGSLVVIGLSDRATASSVNKKTFSKKGDYLFIRPGTVTQFTNQNSQAEAFAIFELK